MQIYKLIRIYETPAGSKADAWRLFRETEASGDLSEFLCSEFVKEKEETSFIGQVKKQLKG